MASQSQAKWAGDARDRWGQGRGDCQQSWWLCSTMDSWMALKFYFKMVKMAALVLLALSCQKQKKKNNAETQTLRFQAGTRAVSARKQLTLCLAVHNEQNPDAAGSPDCTHCGGRSPHIGQVTAHELLPPTRHRTVGQEDPRGPLADPQQEAGLSPTRSQCPRKRM